MTKLTDPVDVLICGAGIAGVSAAYYLSVKYKFQRVVLIDERAPLSLTSDHSTEAYRNWWPGPGNAMVALMNRSVDLMEKLADESGNIFHLNRRGYLYCTADAQQLPNFIKAAEDISKLGAGPLRTHSRESQLSTYIPAQQQGFVDQPTGADLILDPEILRKHFPGLSEQILAALHVRRAGWLSAQQLGMYLLNQARAHGVTLYSERVAQVNIINDRVDTVLLSDGTRIKTKAFVNAAGPYLKNVGKMLCVDIPVHHELILKTAIIDHLGVVDRSSPLLIWADPQTLDWSDEEKEFLAEDQETQWLFEVLPPGAHTRPDGGNDSQVVLMLWEYRTRLVEPVYPIPLDPQIPEIVLRGLFKLLPGLGAYFNRIPKPRIDGGYYTKTRENRPIIGHLPIKGGYVIGALSGFGIMASCAAGELLAATIAGDRLPDYAPAFSLARYADPEYKALLEKWGESGQL